MDSARPRLAAHAAVGYLYRAASFRQRFMTERLHRSHDVGRRRVYVVRRVSSSLTLTPAWDAPAWMAAETAPVDHFHPRSTDHRPAVAARLLYNDEALYLQFRVFDDRYVRVVATRFMEPVYRDSCVEFFVRPRPDAGYFNFEINAGGTLLASHVRDWRRDAKGLTDAQPLSADAAQMIRIVASLPRRVEPELPGPITWGIAARIPYAVFEPFIGTVTPRSGDEWTGNFYKCADATSQPHWASWSPIGEALNFHCPEHFGRLRFE